MKALLIGEAAYPGKCMNLSSYMLKTAVLHHVHTHPQCRDMRYTRCIPQIIEYLGNCFQQVRMPCFFARKLDVWGDAVVAPILEHAYKLPDIDNKTAYSMLWVEFWRRVVLVIGELLSEEFVSKQANQPDISNKLASFRALVAFLLEQYFRSRQYRSAALLSASGPTMPFRHIPQNVKSEFPQYIENWKKIVSCTYFDIDRLVQIDPIENNGEMLYQR